MSDKASRLNAYLQQMPAHVQLAAVSKFHTVDEIMEVYNAGQRIFAESRVQELCGKVDHLPKDIHWHFIGPLQTNKVKYLAPFIDLVHSVDSMRLFRELDKQARKQERKISILLQVYIADEETKSGFDPEEIPSVIEQIREQYPDSPLQICGLMGMATYTDNQDQIRAEFASLKKLFDQIKVDYFAADDEFAQLSMGMSGDYQIAIEEGSTIIRIGTAIFGERSY